jgi:hypothetical protein
VDTKSSLIRIKISGFEGCLDLMLPLADASLACLSDGWLDQLEIGQLDQSIGALSMGSTHPSSRTLFEVLHQKRIGDTYSGKDNVERWNLQALRKHCNSADRIAELPWEVAKYRWGKNNWPAQGLNLDQQKGYFASAIATIAKEPSLASTDKTRLCNLQLLYMLAAFSGKTGVPPGPTVTLLGVDFPAFSPLEAANYDRIKSSPIALQFALAQQVAAIRPGIPVTFTGAMPC